MKWPNHPPKIILEEEQNPNKNHHNNRMCSRCNLQSLATSILLNSEMTVTQNSLDLKEGEVGISNRGDNNTGELEKRSSQAVIWARNHNLSSAMLRDPGKSSRLVPFWPAPTFRIILLYLRWSLQLTWKLLLSINMIWILSRTRIFCACESPIALTQMCTMSAIMTFWRYIKEIIICQINYLYRICTQRMTCERVKEGWITFIITIILNLIDLA